MKIRTKLALLLLVASASIVAGLALFSVNSLDTYIRSRLLTELSTQVRQADVVIRSLMPHDSTGYDMLRRYASSANVNLTLLDGAGVVIFDSDIPPQGLPGQENYLHHPEVQEALKNDSGASSRYSRTMNVDILYLARKAEEPFPPESAFPTAVIERVARPMTEVDEVTSGIRSKIIIAGIVLFCAVAGLTLYATRRLALPVAEIASIADEIRKGGLEKRIPVHSKDEFGELAKNLNAMIDKLNEDITKLKKLERVRSEFLGNVSHELRTPIFAMQGMLETLAQGAIDDKEVSHDFVGRALANTQRLNTLLGDLIEISRIESGEMKMSFRYFDLAEFLRATVAEQFPGARQKNIDCLLEEQPGETQCYGDKERLKQVMVNLIDNAVKYTSPGGRVTISYRTERDAVRVTVADTGVGISNEHRTRIFERFYRVDRERSREAGGTGLGLAIVKHIVEAHGSRVELESEVGKGSSFSFVLKS